MPPRYTSHDIAILLRIVDQAFDHKSWHGTNLRGSVRGLTAAEASIRPGTGRHNIWEIVVHAAYWKYAVRRRLTGEKRGSFPLDGSNWFKRPTELSVRAWKEDIRLLVGMHETMREAISSLGPADLEKIPDGNKTSTWDIIAGIAAHDLYHAGQIQIIKRFFR
jgi:uncharacterized damage-inducible protein DinB